MPQIINTNIASLNAQRNLDKAQSGNDTALQRLSSGLRINSSKDDAAGLSISTRFEAQLSGTDVAIRNAGDGISLSQTAEGALDSITSNLQRVRELAVQSANGTNADVDRDALNAEAQQLLEEISNTAENANYNGINLLDGSFSTSLQVGANAGDTLDVSIGAVTTDTLGVADSAGLSAIGSDNAIGNGDLTINGIEIASSTSDDDTFSTDNASASAISKAAAINKSTEDTGVSAFANENTVSGSEMTAAAGNGSVDINGVTISLSTSADAAASRASVVQAINAVSDQTGVVATDSGSDVNGISLAASDGRNVEVANFTTVTAESTGLAAADTYEGGYTLVSSDGSDIEVSGGDGTGTGNLANAGLTAGTFSGNAAALSAESTAVRSGEQATTGGTASNTLAAAGANQLTADETTAVFSDGTTVLEDGNTVIDLASSINASAVGGSIVAYEKADLVIDFGNAASTFVAGDDFIIGAGTLAAATTVTWTAGTSKENFANEINNADYSGSNIDVKASYDADTDFLSLEIKAYGTDGTDDEEIDFSFSAGDLQLVSVNGNAAAGTIGGNVVSGVLAFESLDDTITSVSVTDAGAPPPANLFENNGEAIDLGRVNTLDSGDLVLNGVAIGAAQASDDKSTATLSSNGDIITSVDKSANGISIAEAINRNSAETGVTATVNETKVIGGDGSNVAEAAAVSTAGDAANLYINGVGIGAVTLADVTGSPGTIDTDKAKADALAAINAVSGQTGVTAEDNGVSLTLTAADGRAISVAIDTDAAANTGTAGDAISSILGLDSQVDGIGATDFAELAGSGAGLTAAQVEAVAYETTNSSVSLSAGGQFTIEAGANGADELASLGLSAGTFGAAEDGQFLKDVDISTVDGANAALSAIDNALSQVASERANLGATQNRLDSTVSNLAINKENLAAANSRIKDADFAAETAELSRTQVLIQAGISVLAQANARPQQVLSLLG